MDALPIEPSYVIAGTVATAFLGYQAIKRSPRQLPPGPKGYPLVGNMYDVTETHEWLTYHEMSKKYSASMSSFKSLPSSR